MKKILTLVLALALFITALSGCGSKPAADKTPRGAGRAVQLRDHGKRRRDGGVQPRLYPGQGR